MQLKVEPDCRHHQPCGDDLLLPAKDGARRRYTVAIRRAEWNALSAGHADPVAVVREVEYLAMSGRWESCNGRRVWRVRRG